MGEKYRLLMEFNINHERDRGYRPSGYARLSLSLMPNLNNENIVSIDEFDRAKWIIRETKDTPNYYGSLSSQEIESIYNPFIQMIYEGVKDGGLSVLNDFLDNPVVGVNIRVNQATFDLVYSTKMSFELAAKEAVQILLNRAKEEGMLKLNE